MELNLAKDVKSNKKSSCKYIIDKRKTKENINAYLNEAGDLVTVKTEKSEALNAPFIPQSLLARLVFRKCGSYRPS